MSTRREALTIHRHYKFFMLAAAALLAVILIFAGTARKDRTVNASTHNEKYFKCIDIAADDTLWSIAEENITEEYASVSDYIDEVKSINGLTGDKIYSGATLVVPYYQAPQ